VIRGNVTNSNIDVYDLNTVQIQSGKTLLGDELVQPTEHYKRVVECESSLLQMNKAKITLNDKYVSLKNAGI